MDAIHRFARHTLPRNLVGALGESCEPFMSSRLAAKTARKQPLSPLATRGPVLAFRGLNSQLVAALSARLLVLGTLSLW